MFFKTSSYLLILLFIMSISGCTSKNISYYDVYGTITTKEFNSSIANTEASIAGKGDYYGEYNSSIDITDSKDIQFILIRFI